MCVRVRCALALPVFRCGWGRVRACEEGVSVCSSIKDCFCGAPSAFVCLGEVCRVPSMWGPVPGVW
eukprot:9308068-Pyramimonas_sp.AAC.1